MKRNDGFTMIELLVTVTAGALVTLAAVSLLLMGTRIQHGSTTDVKEQQTVRTVLTLMEQMAGSGQFNVIKPTYNGWQLRHDNNTEATEEDDAVLFEYVATKQALYQGAAPEGEEIGSPLLGGLNNAGVTKESERLIRLSFDTDRGESYVTTIYCRTFSLKEDGEAVKDAQDIVQELENTQEGTEMSSVFQRRIQFLNTLATQYKSGTNTGEIIYPQGENGPQYYSQWYVGSGWGDNGWNKDTPWCACFASWAAVKTWENDDNYRLAKHSPFVFANVDTGMAAFQNTANGDQWKTDDPKPGDYIFFDWSGEKKDPAHVGVVLDVRGNDIYTIEGNSSNRVSVRKYSLNEKAIMGYGVLPQFVEGIDA